MLQYNSCVRSGEIAAPCVTWQDMQAHSRIDSESDKTLMESYLSGSDALMRSHLNMALIQQEFTVRYSRFAFKEEHLDSHPPSFLDSAWTRRRNGRMYLPIYPLVADGEISVFYIDENGDEQEQDDFQIDYWTKPGFIAPLPGECWPSVQCENINAVRIVFPAGFGDNASDVPEQFKQLIRLCAAYWYELRIPITFDMNVREMPTPAGFDQMIINLRVE